MTTPVVLTPIVRVMLIVGKQCMDVELPIGIPIRDVIFSLEPLIHQESDTAHYLENQHLVLGPVGRPPFAEEATLEALAIYDGSILILQNKTFPGTFSPSIVEDIAQLASSTSVTEPVRGPILLTRTFLSQFLFANLFFQAVFFFIRNSYASDRHDLFSYPYLFGIILNVLLCVLATTTHRVYTRAKISSTFAAASLFTALISLPMDHHSSYFLPSVLCTMVYIFLWSWIFLSILPYGKPLWAGAAVSAAAVLPLITVCCFVTIPATTIGVLLVVISFVLQLGASNFGQIIIGLPHKRVPEQNAHTTMIFTKPFLQNMRESVHDTKQAILGIIFASIILQCSGYLFFAETIPTTIYLIITVTATLLRMNIWMSHAIKRMISWIIPFVLSICCVKLLCSDYLLAAYLIAGVMTALPLCAIATVTGLPFITSPLSYPLAFRFLTRMISCALDITLTIGALYLTGVFSWALHH